MSPNQIAAINPNTKTAPVFRSNADADLTAKIYGRLPVLINEAKGRDGNPWDADFHTRIWHMAEDSQWFQTAAELRVAGFKRDGVDWVFQGLALDRRAFDGAGESDAPIRDRGGGSLRGDERYLPLYEAKMMHLFDHRWATYDERGEASRDVTPTEKADPNFEPVPRYWVPEAEVAARLAAKNWSRGWLMGWRDITNATNERTVIMAAIPRVAVGHTSPLMFVRIEGAKTGALVANASSLVLDFVAVVKT